MASVPQPLPPIPSTIASITGPPLIGINLGWFLYGILVIQTLYTVFAIDTIQTILVAVDSYRWFASGYGDMREMAAPLISPFNVPILDGLLAFIVQVLFCWRIGVLQKSVWLPSIVLVVAMASLGGALSNGIGGFQLASLAELNTLIIQTCYITWFWLAGGALADTLIAVIMTWATWLLLREGSRSQLPQTGTLLVQIVRLTVETVTLTALIVIAMLVCLLVPRLQIPSLNSTASVAFGYVFGKLYSNGTLMAVLNDHMYLRDKSMAEWHHSSSGKDTARAQSSLSVEEPP
ncbi:hypothetical protein FPV67DRAFT_1454994 [Lyophyllum atratum]|nr:hypothetical protein FPV67DRAFT_1454994 [Lyophyllum atratum]